MKASELRGKSEAELKQDLLIQLESSFKSRMQKATGQLGQTHVLKQSKKEIARIKTVLNEKKAGRNS